MSWWIPDTAPDADARIAALDNRLEIVEARVADLERDREHPDRERA